MCNRSNDCVRFKAKAGIWSPTSSRSATGVGANRRPRVTLPHAFKYTKQVGQ